MESALGHLITIRIEPGDDSGQGEIHYAEADTLLGPWIYAKKVVTHKNYSCYNPCLHPYFQKDGGRVVVLSVGGKQDGGATCPFRPATAR